MQQQLPLIATGWAESGELTHGIFTNLLDKLEAGDLLVFNNTQVIPARIFGRKDSGSKVEVTSGARTRQSPRVGARSRRQGTEAGCRTYTVLGDDESIAAIIAARHDTLFELRFNDNRNVFSVLNAVGHIPLPPYIDRPDEDADLELYQTVYSEKPGLSPRRSLVCTSTNCCWLRCMRKALRWPLLPCMLVLALSAIASRETIEAHVDACGIH